MAFGITPQEVRELDFEKMSQDQILLVGIEAAKQLGWSLGQINQNGFKAYTGLSLSSYGEEFTFQVSGYHVSLKSECTGSQLIDWGKNSKNIDRFVDAFMARPTPSPEGVAVQLTELQNATGPSDLNQETIKDSPRGFLSFFVPSKDFIVTPLLIDLNIVLFLLFVTIGGAGVLLPDTEDLIAWGANFRPVTLDGQPWRLLTSCFLHIGIIHLLMNLYALAYIGVYLEPLIGRIRFFTAYILTGIAGSTVSLFWHDLTVSAGASGAIFGMYGVFLAMLTTNLIEKSARRQLLTSIGIFVGYNLLNGMRGGIDNAAHLGGLVSGLVAGYAFFPSLKQRETRNLSFAAIGILSVLVLASAWFVYRSTPNDLGMYDKKMAVFVALEEKAMKVYRLGENAKDDELLEAIREDGIKNWQQAISVVRDADLLKLPEVLHQRNQKLIEYCELRIDRYDLMYKAISEATNVYQSEMNEKDEKINRIIAELGGYK